MSLTILLTSSCEACEKLILNTSTPDEINLLNIDFEALAGPTVATILVLFRFIIQK